MENKQSEMGKKRVIADQQRGFNMAAETEEGAMYHIGYRQGKPWSREEFFADGVIDVHEYTSSFFTKMQFNPKDKIMLDIGCGIGRMTKAFADIFCEAYGVDFSSNMIDNAIKIHANKSNIHFSVNNGLDLSNFQDNFFDFCFSYIVFHHIHDQEAVIGYIKEIDRVLRPGGLFMFQVNTDKWSMKAFNFIPIHYRVREILNKTGLMQLYARLINRDPASMALASPTLPVYYTSPKKIKETLDYSHLKLIEVSGLGTRYTWYSGVKADRLNN